MPPLSLPYLLRSNTMSRKEKMLEFVDEGYNVSVCGRHLHVTDAMKQYASEKIARLEKLGDRIIEVNVTMDIQKLEHRVDVVMKYGHTNIKSSGISRDMYLSIDKAIEKLEAQLRKYLDRIHHHHAKEHPHVEIYESVYERELDEDEVALYNREIEEENKKRQQSALQLPSVVTTETRTLKILTNEEAIMKMDLSKDEVLVFRSEDDRRLKVMYRRNDGNYGVIAPE